MTPEQQSQLEKLVRSRRGRVEQTRRARCVLFVAEGLTWAEVRERLDCTDSYINRWTKRFAKDGVAGLVSRYRGSARRTLTGKLAAKIWNATRRGPTDGTTHWSTRRLAKHLGVSHMMVARVWAQYELQPHRLERYMASDDPEFEAKAADILGLYLHPPQHAAVFCVDEKTAIQALDRLDPVLPLSPGRAERHGFEYRRTGTLSLYAAFNTRNGEVFGSTAERHTSAAFVAFLTELIGRQPPGRVIHIILDNLSAHKTHLVRDFLAAHPTVRLHYTPTYSSWLNQVELWLAKLERDVIARGVFTSPRDLAKKLLRYIRHYNTAPRPVHWTYDDPTRRIKPAA